MLLFFFVWRGCVVIYMGVQTLRTVNTKKVTLVQPYALHLDRNYPLSLASTKPRQQQAVVEIISTIGRSENQSSRSRRTTPLVRLVGLYQVHYIPCK